MVQIGVEVAARGADGRVAEPGFYDVGVDARFKQVYGGGVAQAVRGQALAGDARADAGRKPQVLLDEGSYSEAGKGAAALVNEETVGGGGRAFAAVVVEIEFEEPDRGRPQRRDPLSLALADDGNGPVGEIEPVVARVGGFLGAGAGVIEESENGQVAYAVGPGGARLGEKRFEFLAAEGVDGFGRDPFDGDSEDAFGLSFESRGMKGEVLKEALDGGQAQVTALGTVASAADGVLQVGQEGENGLGVDILNGQGLRSAFSGAEVGKQELEGIAVALDRVRAERPLIAKIDLEEVS